VQSSDEDEGLRQSQRSSTGRGPPSWPLLGVRAVEASGLKVDPRTGELEEASPEG